ncbi:methyltransferase-like protein 24 [Arapaima gigas]
MCNCAAHPQRGAGEQLELQPWAARQPSFTAELQRFIAYISTPQVQCSQLLYPREDPAGPWALCVDGWTLPVDEPQPCVSYSFSMDQKDADFVDRMLQAGCEVHQFDPSRKQESGSGRLRRHRAWVDWRGSRKLSAIMDTLGHAEVHFLNMDLESAEWRVLESWAADGTLSRIQQLLVTVHLHWAGFEVPGTDAEVLRFWYSVVRRLDASGFDLLYSVGGAGDTILHHLVPGAHSTYSLSWVRTRGPG